MRPPARLTTAALCLAVLSGCAEQGQVLDGEVNPGETMEDPDGTANGTPEGTVRFAGVVDGDTVETPLSVSFETDGFEIVPADTEGQAEGQGHMHVMIDVGCVTPGEVIPSDDAHVHFGDGATSADLELEQGEHTLCLQAGDGDHVALDVTDEITITVDGAADPNG